jgi:hypothetical protein
METKCSTGKLRRRLLRVCGAPERSAVVTLARREAGARSVVAVNRRRLPLSRVLRRGDGAAVLGFSLDGDYLRTTHAWADMLAVRLTDLRICVCQCSRAGVKLEWTSTGAARTSCSRAIRTTTHSSWPCTRCASGTGAGATRSHWAIRCCRVRRHVSPPVGSSLQG